MSHDEFTKLFKYVEEMRQEMNARFDKTATKKQVDELACKIAQKTGVKLSYE